MENNLGENSYFDGKVFDFFKIAVIGGILTSLTFGIFAPWAMCMLFGWQINNSVVNGKRLKFSGTGGMLIGPWIKWIIFTMLTFGIYGLWFSVNLEKFKVKNTSFQD